MYLLDNAPGFSRKRRGKKFIYFQLDGSRVSDPQHLERIRKLAIPPAYESVWISPLPNGHLQATGRDARGRKQYIYHADWRQHRDETKFDRMLEFGHALPDLRTTIQHDLEIPAGTSVTRQVVIAAVVALLDRTCIRIGNDEYARSNGTYGLTTLRKRHVDLQGNKLRLRFKGKRGIIHEIALQDRRIARIVKRCQTLPGQELFKYVDEENTIHSIGSKDVNEYLRVASGGEFTAKDFRTWHASVQALELWQQSTAAAEENQAQTVESAKQLLAEVAKSLGNTVAVCRKSYIHPQVLALIAGEKISSVASLIGSVQAEGFVPVSGLSDGENAFLTLLSVLDCKD